MHELPGIDPSRAENLQQLGAMVAGLIESHSMSRRQAAIAAGISPSTVGEIISARRENPHPNSFKKLIDIFGLPDAEGQAWITRRMELLRVDSAVGQREILARLERAETATAEAQNHVAHLQKETARLQAALEVEQQRTADLTMSRNSVSAEAEDLKVQLRYVKNELLLAEHDLRNLIEQKSILETANNALQAQLELLLEEQAQRESAERSIQQLKAQVSEIGQAYSLLRSEKLTREPEEVAVQPVPEDSKPEQAKNEPLVTEIAVRDRDFGKPYEFWITFPWFCENCKIGGSKQQLVCSNCRGGIVYEEMQSVKLKELPEASYGKTLVVSSVGNFDNPKLPRGDVHVQVMRKEPRPRWQ